MEIKVDPVAWANLQSAFHMGIWNDAVLQRRQVVSMGILMTDGLHISLYK